MRLALISDVHEDYFYLKKILKSIETMGFDKLICLGDITGFSKPFYTYKDTRDAVSCLHMLREKCDVFIPGNHDLHAARRLPEHSDIFDFPPSWYDLDLEHRSSISNNEIWLHEGDLDPNYSTEDLKFLQSLPEFVILETPDYQILLSHYAYPNLSGFSKSFYAWEGEFKAHFAFMKENNCSVGFIGHAHPRGAYKVTPNSFKHRGYRKQKINKLPAILGVPPVTRHKISSSFCIFDTSSRIMQIIKQS